MLRDVPQQRGNQGALTSAEPELLLPLPPAVPLDWPPLEAMALTSSLERLAKLPGLLLSAIVDCGVLVWEVGVGGCVSVERGRCELLLAWGWSAVMGWLT